VRTSFAQVISFVDGNVLLEKCTGSPMEQRQCTSYIAGVSDEMAIQRRREGKPECLSSGIEIAQLRDLTLNYLGTHPATRHYSAAELIHDAINSAFRCF
jgi:Rap1a immunity proteins